VEFHVGDAGGLERRFLAHFDAVWCPGVLHHLSDRQIDTLLLSSRAALKPGGCFVSMDPSSTRAVNLFKPFFRRIYHEYHSPEERQLRPRDVVEKLQAAGFGEIEVRFTDWFISPLAWVFPRLTEPIAPLLVWIDQLLVKTPFLDRFSSGFALVARNGR
jgi:SAM-dependent methyltransferase